MYLGTSIKLNSVPLSEKTDSGTAKSEQILLNALLTSISCLDACICKRKSKEHVQESQIVFIFIVIDVNGFIRCEVHEVHLANFL